MENGETEDATDAKPTSSKNAGDTTNPPEQEEEEDEDEAEAEAAMMPVRGPLPAQEGSWASCIRLLDPVEGATVECLELGNMRCVSSLITRKIDF